MPEASHSFLSSSPTDAFRDVPEKKYATRRVELPSRGLTRTTPAGEPAAVIRSPPMATDWSMSDRVTWKGTSAKGTGELAGCRLQAESEDGSDQGLPLSST